MRRLWIFLAQYAPAPPVATRLGKIVKGLAVLLAGVWTLITYRDQVNLQSANSAFLLLERYEQSIARDSEAERTAMAVHQSRLELLLRQYTCHLAEAPDPANPPVKLAKGCADPSQERLRRAGMVIGQKDEAGRLAVNAAIEAALTQNRDLTLPEPLLRKRLVFLQSVALCIEQGVCRRDITLQLFEAELVTFLNSTCPVTARSTLLQRDARMLADFIRRERGSTPPIWTNDPRQRQQFFCAFLREDSAAPAPAPAGAPA